MAPLLTAAQLAECLAVHPVLIAKWEAEGMPRAEGSGPSRSGRRWWRVSRRDLAAHLDLHPDSVSRNLSGWLRPALLERGGHGKTQWFDLRVAIRDHWEKQGLMKAVRDEDAVMRKTLETLLANLPDAGPAPRRATHTSRRAGPSRRNGDHQ